MRWNSVWTINYCNDLEWSIAEWQELLCVYSTFCQFILNGFMIEVEVHFIMLWRKIPASGRRRRLSNMLVWWCLCSRYENMMLRGLFFFCKMWRLCS